jgi:3-dehydroquinate dehydratase-2
MSKTIYVINGPNLNLLGSREPEIYGRATLADVEKLCQARAKERGFSIAFHQSNHEGDIVDWIQEAASSKAAGIVINPGAFTHTSIAILDAILASHLPVIEIHISNIHAREDFRRQSHVSKAARGVICGFGIEGYGLAIEGLASLVAAEKRP